MKTTPAAPNDTDTWLSGAVQVLTSASDVMPTSADVESLKERCGAGLERGYFTPDEERRIRAMFASYMQVRVALVDVIQEARQHIPIFRRRLNHQEQRIFLVGWVAGCMVMRSSRYLAREVHAVPLLRQTLNQTDQTNGIPPGMVDQVYRRSSHPRHLIRFFWAMDRAEAHADDLQALADDEIVAPLLPLLHHEQPFIEQQKRDHAKAYAASRWIRVQDAPHQSLKAMSFKLFEGSGRFIAECRNPFHRKRVRPAILRAVAKQLKPGDIFITRHDDALSNWFLPGFWPHAALSLGTAADWKRLGVEPPGQGKEPLPRHGPCILEARKDGVHLRALSDTLSVDAYMLLRPKDFGDAEQKHLLELASTHVGKSYDFEFDFNRSDRLVCTEVVYRSMDGIGPVSLTLTRKAGRYTLPAEELARQGLEGGFLELLEVYGLQGNQALHGDQALRVLKRSLSFPEENSSFD